MKRAVPVPTGSDLLRDAAPRGRAFVDTKQRFIALFATERAWAYAMACITLVALVLLALESVHVLALEDELAHRQVVIVGETTAHQLVPLWPNGVGSTVCDEPCVEGSLEDWIPAFRAISGEQDGMQTNQHLYQAKAASFIAKGSPAAAVVSQYYQQYPPFDLAAKGVRLDVTAIHVDADHQTPNRYSARWTDVVTDERTRRVIGRHAFGAEIDTRVDPTARTEDQIRFNPGGVFITDLHLFGEQ